MVIGSSPITSKKKKAFVSNKPLFNVKILAGRFRLKKTEFTKKEFQNNENNLFETTVLDSIKNAFYRNT